MCGLRLRSGWLKIYASPGGLIPAPPRASSSHRAKPALFPPASIMNAPRRKNHAELCPRSGSTGHPCAAPHNFKTELGI